MSRFVRALGAILGMLVGIQLASIDVGGHPLFSESPSGNFLLALWVVAWLVVGLLILPHLTIEPAGWLIRGVRALSTGEFVTAIAGLLIGLLMGLLLGLPLARFPDPYGRYLPIGVSLVLGLGMLGLTVAKRHDLADAITALGLVPDSREATSPAGAPFIVADTSAIIDGRIADVVESGFLFGTLVVPRFVLAELQYIADQSDARKRARGRRGLDILNALRRNDKIAVEISEADPPGIPEVDAKLVALAKARGAAILTNDLNLNKVAELEGLRVLNVNSLANAVKPAFLPGDQIRVHVIQEGKEPGQGVGFLDDGTMVVVEGGARRMNVEVCVGVTRVLQTVAGRMVFGQPVDE
ncbi:MAG: PIN domain-containing protein [Chloroflexi bacterium]|nr:PIN domain-containing protein [Chloroflexota bacterium]